MSDLPLDLDIGRDEAFDKARWDRAMAWIAAKIRTHDAFQPSWEAAVNELREFGLVRLNDAVQPVYDRLNEIAQLGAIFTATSASSVSVGVGTKVFELAEGYRARFAAAAYISIQKTGDPTVAMWGPLSSYDRATGLLTVLVEQVVGTGGADNWVISASVAPDALHAGRTDNPHGVTAAQVGAATPSEMASAIASAIAALKGDVSAGYATLKAIEDKIAPILAGADSAYDTFAEIYAYITSDQSAAAAVNSALANRLRIDAEQGLSSGQKSLGRANLGFASTTIKGALLRFSDTSGSPGQSSALFQSDDGKVGIGTSNPTEILHLVLGGATLKFLTGSNNSGYEAHFGVNDDGFNLITNSISRGFNFKNPGGTLLTIAANGNVGIGVTAPSTSLQVSGPIRCASYTVATAPSPSASGAGSIIFVTNASGGASHYYSNGSNWLRVGSMTILS